MTVGQQAFAIEQDNKFRVADVVVNGGAIVIAMMFDHKKTQQSILESARKNILAMVEGHQ